MAPGDDVIERVALTALLERDPGNLALPAPQ